jgi:hypothetical protein
VPERVLDQQRVERVPDPDRLGDRGVGRVQCEHGVAKAHHQGLRRREHAAAGTGADGDDPARLRDPDRLVEGPDRYLAPGPQLFLRAEPVSRRGGVGDGDELCGGALGAGRPGGRAGGGGRLLAVPVLRAQRGNVEAGLTRLHAHPASSAT